MAKESPKIIFKVSQDFIPDTTPEPTVPFFAVFNHKGPLEDTLVNLDGYKLLFGEPDPLNYGTSALYPYLFLERTGGVAYVRRALHVEDNIESNIAKYSAALVRWIKDDVNDPVVKPLTDGLSIAEVQNYSFPTSADDRQVYKKSTSILQENVTASNQFKVVQPDELLNDATQVSFMTSGTLPDDDTDLYDITDSVYVAQIDDYIKLSAVTGVEVTEGLAVREVYDDAGTDKLREILSPTTGLYTRVAKTATSTTADVIVDDNDNIAAGMRIAFVADTEPLEVAYLGTVHTVNSKYSVDVSHVLFTIDGTLTATITNDIYVRVNSDLKEQDAFLVVSVNPGKAWNDLSVTIEDNDEAPDLFDLTVYVDGAEKETFTCSRDKSSTDSFGNSRFIEDKINGQSLNIWVYDNPDAISALDGTPHKPLETDYMILRPDLVPNYVDTGLITTEQLLSGDSVIYATGTNAELLAVSVQDILVLTDSTGTKNTYTVNTVSIDTIDDTKASITVVGTINENYAIGVGIELLDGYTQNGNITISGSDQTLDIGDSYTYDGTGYTVVDAGSNWFKGGQDGLIGSDTDFITAFENLTNRIKMPEEILVSDSGLHNTTVFNALSTKMDTRKLGHVYGGTPFISKNVPDSTYVSDNVAYGNSTLNTSRFASLFVGFSQVGYDSRKFWLSDSVFTIINQYNNALIQEGVLPACNNRGKITGILDKDRDLDQTYQDVLEKSQLNYARKVGAGYTNMSNTTRFNITSYFQFRHIGHYINAITSIVESVFQPYLQEVVTDNDVENVDTALGNLLTRQLRAMTASYETHSSFLSNGNGTTTWSYRLEVQPKDITTKIIFNVNVTNKTLEVTVED